jgi:hypothetical protein
MLEISAWFEDVAASLPGTTAPLTVMAIGPSVWFSTTHWSGMGEIVTAAILELPKLATAIAMRRNRYFMRWSHE